MPEPNPEADIKDVLTCLENLIQAHETISKSEEGHSLYGWDVVILENVINEKTGLLWTLATDCKYIWSPKFSSEIVKRAVKIRADAAEADVDLISLNWTITDCLGLLNSITGLPNNGVWDGEKLL